MLCHFLFPFRIATRCIDIFEVKIRYILVILNYNLNLVTSIFENISVLWFVIKKKKYTVVTLRLD